MKLWLCFLLLSTNTPLLLSQEIRDKFVENDNTYEIVIKFENGDYKDYTYSFNVYLNGRECISPDNSQNELKGCSYDLVFDGSLELKITRITLNNHQKGWTISGLGSICGNTYSERIWLIIPHENSTVQHFEIDAKAPPIFNPINESEIEIWSYYQEWGLTVTSESFFVPKKMILQFDKVSKHKASLVKGDMLERINILDNADYPEYLSPNYIGLLTAGLNDFNPNLVTYAFKNYFNSELIDWYIRQRIPTTSTEIFAITDSMTERKAIPKKFAHLIRN